MLDALLVCGLIEARSHERLGLLAEHCPEPELAKFYHGLMASEARHYGVYWTLATTYCDRAVVNQRLEELAAVESELLFTLHPEPRIPQLIGKLIYARSRPNPQTDRHRLSGIIDATPGQSIAAFSLGCAIADGRGMQSLPSPLSESGF